MAWVGWFRSVPCKRDQGTKFFLFCTHSDMAAILKVQNSCWTSSHIHGLRKNFRYINTQTCILPHSPRLREPGLVLAVFTLDCSKGCFRVFGCVSPGCLCPAFRTMRLEVNLLGHMVHLLSFLRNSQTAPQWLHHLPFSQSFQFLPSFANTWHIPLAKTDGYFRACTKQGHSEVWICVTLVTNDGSNTFSVTQSLCVFSGQVFISILSPLSLQLSFSSGPKEGLHIFWMLKHYTHSRFILHP